MPTGRLVTQPSPEFATVEHKDAPAFETYERIRQYCVKHSNARGGSYCQEPYKRDFFLIFFDAFHAGCCSDRTYRARKRKLKRKRIHRHDYVVYGANIRAYLDQRWCIDGKRSRLDNLMVEDLCQWWDSWAYAWSWHIGQLPCKLDEARRIIETYGFVRNLDE